MSEKRDDSPLLTNHHPNERILDNAKRISQYMREQLDELRDMLRGEPMIPNRNPLAERGKNGRDEALEYRSPLEATDDRGEVLVEDALDADVVYLVSPEPQDRLDVEIHMETCLACALNSGRYKLCAHCLEPKLCSDVPVQLRATKVEPYQLGDFTADSVIHFARLSLCRECKRDADNTHSLVLEE